MRSGVGCKVVAPGSSGAHTRQVKLENKEAGKTCTHQSGTNSSTTRSSERFENLQLSRSHRYLVSGDILKSRPTTSLPDFGRTANTMLSTIGRAAVHRLVSKPIATSSAVSRLSLRAGVSQNSLGWLVSSFQKSCAVRSFASEADGAKAPKTTTRKRAATKASATPKKAAAKPKKTKVVKKKVVKKSTPATGEKKKKAATRRKRELTPEEKVKLQIKELKNTSLYFTEPKNAGAVTPWPLFLQENLSGSKPRSMEANNERFKELAVDFKSLSSSELARLQSVCEENRLKNAATFKAWVESHTPEQIRDANNARNMLKRKFDYPKAPKTKHLINDDRKPASPVPSYGYFTKARWASGDFNNMNVKEAATSIAAEWKNMSESEKKPYMDLGQADVHRFLKATDRATS